jgi:hypothetical protein
VARLFNILDADEGLDELDRENAYGFLFGKAMRIKRRMRYCPSGPRGGVSLVMVLYCMERVRTMLYLHTR